jgi:hypothetical protein
MKKILIIVVLSLTFTSLSAQKSIDALFNKYSGKDGFVCVSISGNILKLITDTDDKENRDDDFLPAKVTEIRILAPENKDIVVENFYEAAMKGIKVGDYEEFMSVEKSNQDLKMFVRAEGNKFREFLLIAGGVDNVLIQIKGEMTFKEARKFSENVKKNNGLDLVADHR